MTAPTAATLALLRSNLPVRRVASPTPQGANQFASLLKQASTNAATPKSPTQPLIYHTQMRPGMPANTGALSTQGTQSAQAAQEAFVPGGPAPMSRSDILKNAQGLMGVPYVWGGTVNSGLDCSAFVSKVWGVSRHTTDNLNAVSYPISKDELQPGDALNLTTGADPEGDGHVRLFAGWADAAHTKMDVYEETPPKSVHHVINWDPKYQPMRRTNVIDA